MKASDEPKRSQDQQLAARFAQLRASELADLPAALNAEQLAARAQGADLGGSRAQRLLRPSLALAASALFASVILLQMPSEQADPADLYADIMAGSSFTTDALMQVSSGISPESVEYPRLFDVPVNSAGWMQ